MKGLLARLGLLSRKMRTGFFLGLFILFSVFSSILFHLQFDLLDIESLQYDEGAIDTAFDWRFKMPDESSFKKKLMRAIEITKFGGPENLKITKRPIPDLEKNQVLIKVQFAGVNRTDAHLKHSHTHTQCARI